MDYEVELTPDAQEELNNLEPWLQVQAESFLYDKLAKDPVNVGEKPYVPGAENIDALHSSD